MEIPKTKESTFNILNETFFNQKIKTPEQKTRTFLSLMTKHIPSSTHKAYPFCPTQKEDNTTSTGSPCVIYCYDITEMLKEKKTAMIVITELMRDDSYLKMLGSLNNLTQQETSVFYLLYQAMFKTYNTDTLIHKYIKEHISTIIVQLINNLNLIRDNNIIIVVGKMLRKIIKDKDYLPKFLDVEVFHMLYKHGKSANFILTKEILKIFFYLFDNEKVLTETVAKFLEEREGKFAEMMIQNLHQYEINNNHTENSKHDDPDDQFYYMKRESLILLEKIMNNPCYENFSQAFTNNVEILKLVMILLNNKSNQIVSRAVTLLNFFFTDVESRNNKIKNILYSNKHNFEIFFSKHTNLAEIDTKKNFILYELERLGNLLDE